MRSIVIIGNLEKHRFFIEVIKVQIKPICLPIMKLCTWSR